MTFLVQLPGRERLRYDLLPAVTQFVVASARTQMSMDGLLPPKDIWRDIRLIPLYISAFSLLLLLILALAYIPPLKRFLSKYISFPSTVPEDTLGRPTTLLAGVKKLVRERGGAVVYAFGVVRLLGSAGLVGLQVAALLLGGGVKTEGGGMLAFSYEGWAGIGLTIAYAYTTLLSFLSLSLPTTSTLRRLTSTHATLLLLALWCIFAWRNFLPCTTFTGVPLDSMPAYPWLLWSRGVLVTLVGVGVPLLAPRVYRPLDPLNPAPIPNPEQTAPILFFAFYVFMDPVVFSAYRLPRLPYDLLPPLADYDWATHLAARSFDKLEPLRRREKGLKDRYLFWGLMEIFRWDYVWMSVLIVGRVLTGFLGPVGINRLLNYLETGGEGAEIRPWVWIMLLLLDPVLGSICFHLYIFITTRMIVQTESILTQLIFQHSLKIRLKDDAPPGTATSTAATTASITPDREAELVDVETDTASHADTNGSETVVGTDSSAGGSPTSPPDKGKAKLLAAPAPAPAPEKDAKTDSPEEPKSSHLVGKINNLIGTDLGNLVEGRDFLMVVLQVPLQVAISVWFLYSILGWAAIVGMGFMVLGFPLPGRVAQLVNRVQVERMKKTDARVQAITETMNIMRMIKLFGWESKVKEQMSEKRDEELEWVKKRQILGLVNMNLNFVLPLITMVVTFAFYSLVMKQDLTASRVFSSMVLFDSLRNQLHMCFWEVPMIIQAKVSLDRIDDFLHKTELLDRYAPAKSLSSLQITAIQGTDEVIGFHNATFGWMDTSQGVPTLGRRNFRLHIDDLVFEPDTINLIVGPTGSGKTSVLMALLGEMHFQPSGPDSWFNLPRSRGVAYAAQESWLQNETIKQNILFGEPYNAERYATVIEQCALERDLSLFDAGDETEVGEKGLTLSGGQKARVTLARAIYSRAHIVLLDDVLSALDVHTSRWIVDKCFRGDLIKGRTILLVTHNVAIAAPVAGKIISLGNNGRVVSQGSVAQALSSDFLLRAEMKESIEAVETAEEVQALEGELPKEKKDGKLVLAEEMAEGRLGWKALKLFLQAFGGPFFWFVIILGFFLVELGNVLATWWLGVWAGAYELHDGESKGPVDVVYYLAGYGIIVTAFMIIYALSYLLFTYASISACRKIHNRLRDTVLGSTLRWLDSTPVGRIISRFTQDIRQIDGPLSGMLEELIEMTLSLLIKFGAVVAMSPIFVIPGIVITVVGGWLGQVYIAAQLSVKREMSNCRSPLYNHFAAAVAGLISIRAYGAESSFRDEMVKRIDKYSRPARTFYNLNRWVSVRVDVLGGLFAAGLAAYLVYTHNGVGASNTGFSLNMAVGFSGMILWWVRILNEFEVAGNSLERILDYMVIEQEPPATEEGKPPAYWPASGSIQAENLCARYSKDGPIVLDNLTFEIKSGERVGIVGRTGSGKSSLTLALLRMIPATGIVYFDGRPTHEINLDALRGNLTIIPQDPTLISGTLRTNLDPFSQHDDAVLNDALRAAGLFRLQGDNDEGKITLDTPVSSAGGNFSLGQRQIIALARAIVRGAKVLILDEATASVDADTDNAIQASIRTELRHATLITIAHRLQTIADYDKIMVLDAGKLVEFDSPIALLEKEGSLFRALVEESGDKEALWAMARTSRVGAS